MLTGDARDVLPTLPDKSVHCVVTSPPYFGLRDYGTAQWDGGDAGCDHLAPPKHVKSKTTTLGFIAGYRDNLPEDNAAYVASNSQYRDTCGKCGAVRVDRQIGLEGSLDAYVTTLVAVFHLVWRVLRDDGVCFLNLGDSYFGGGGYSPDSPSNRSGSRQSTNKGSIKGRGRSDGVRRESACDRLDKEPASSQGHDCLCESLCDACLVAYRLGKSHSDGQHVPTPAPSLSAPIHEHTESSPDRLPTSDLTHRASHNGDAILDSERSQFREGEPPLSSLASTLDGSSELHQEDSHQSGTPSACLLCGRSFVGSVPVSERMKACPCASLTVPVSTSDRHASIDGNEAIDGSSVSRKLDKASDLAYPHYTTASRLKPKDLMMVPARVAIALQADGWYLRSAITWCKGSPMPESVRDRPSSATEMIYLLTKRPTYFYDIEATRILANGLNRGYGVEEVSLEAGWSTASGFAAKRRKVSLNDQWAPYLILAVLLTSQRVFVQHRDDLLGKFFDALNLPHNRGTGCAALQSVAVSDAAKIAVQVLNHVCIIIAQHDLQRESELWIRLASCPNPMIGNDGTFTVEQTREVIAKVIANAQMIRDAFPFNALTKRPINIDVIRQAVPLFEAAYASPNDLGDGLVTESLLQQLDLTPSSFSLDECIPVVAQNGLLNDGDYQSHYTTEEPSRRNLWNWWVINSENFPDAHFATFPTKLVEPCIKAGTSERGCCPACGAPWTRVTEQTARPKDRASGKGWLASTEGIVLGRASEPNNGLSRSAYQATQTVSWQRSCTCNAGEPIPCTVLDPFAGAGTTGLVADRLGRDSILIELNPAYAAMASDRITGDAPLFADVTTT